MRDERDGAGMDSLSGCPIELSGCIGGGGGKSGWTRALWSKVERWSRKWLARNSTI